jgi:hypothetical protein
MRFKETITLWNSGGTVAQFDNPVFVASEISFNVSLCTPTLTEADIEITATGNHCLTSFAGDFVLKRIKSEEEAEEYCYNLYTSVTKLWPWGNKCGFRWREDYGWDVHDLSSSYVVEELGAGVVRITENGQVSGAFSDPFYVAPPVLPAFGGPNLVSGIPDATVFPGGSKTFNVTSHFNATKSPGSAFKYFVTTNNHALLEVRNASQYLGTFELKSLGTSGNATVTVKVVGVERDVDVWVATSTFAVSVGNNAPTIKLALPDVSGTQTLSLSEYFKDDHGQLTYSLTVEDPNVVNATLVGSTLYVQNGLFRDGRSLVTVTASDGFANVSGALNATYSFAISFQFESKFRYIAFYGETGSFNGMIRELALTLSDGTLIDDTAPIDVEQITTVATYYRSEGYQNKSAIFDGAPAWRDEIGYN